MQFRGHLLLPGDTGPGLSVNLDVAEHHLAVESDGGGLGAWPLEVVDVERLEGDIFALTVAGEPLRFVADDTIAFAYSGVPTIERVSRPRARFGFRSFLGRIWSAPVESGEPAADSSGRHVESDSPDGSEAPAPESPPAGLPETVEKPAQPTVRNVVSEASPISPLVEVERAEPPPPVEMKRPEPAAAVDGVSETRCLGKRKDGGRCQSPILTASGYCYPHDPRRAFTNKYQAAQDARNRIKREATGRLTRIYGQLDRAMRQVERGELDPETAMAMAQLARTMCAILDVESPPPDDDQR